MFHLVHKYVEVKVLLITDHVSLQVGEGGQVKDALDEVGWAGLAQPQKHGVSVLQQ